MNNDFFYRPIWQQYGISFCIVTTIFFFNYLFFLNDITQEVNQQKLLSQTNNQEINRLQTTIERYRQNHNTMLRLISEKDLAKAINKNHLILNSFKYYKANSIQNWDIELKGKFLNFLSFIKWMKDNDYYIDIKNLMINREINDLTISFTIVFDIGKA